MQNDFKGCYSPETLSKIRQTKSIKLLTKVEREEELKDVYHFLKPSGDYSEVLIIDDILTTGTTLREIVRAIRSKDIGLNVTLFTLANTDHDAVLNKKVTLAGYEYTWQDDQWSTVYDQEESYLSLSQLKTCIMNDNFSDI